MSERTINDDLLDMIADKSLKQAAIADMYVSVIAGAYRVDGQNPFDVPRINAAIVARWSKSGLDRVKKMAWDLWHKELQRRGAAKIALGASAGEKEGKGK